MSAFVDNDKICLNEKVDFATICSQIAEENRISDVEEAFYVCDLGDIISKHELWLKSFPRITPFYAVKCNPNNLILKLMANMGLSFDCASKSEISAIMDLGVASSRIIYANPCKQISHIKYATSNNVTLMTCDTVSEVTKIHMVYPGASIVIRIFVETSKARCPLGLKFGATPHDVINILEKCAELKMNVVGVSFHVGSGCFDASVYGYAIKESRKVFDIAISYGFHMNVLDIGGGFPGDLQKDSNYELFCQVRNVINQSLEEHFPPSKYNGDEFFVIAEPGRYYVSSAFHLCCTVTSKKGSKLIIETNSSSPPFSYYLNDGVYGSFNCVIFDHYIPDSYLLSSNSSVNYSDSYSSVLWGPTCDSMDKICEVMLPELSIEDNIVFSDMGAYTMAAGSTFNGFKRPQIHFFVSEKYASVLCNSLCVSFCVEKEKTECCSDISWSTDDGGNFLVDDNLVEELMFDIEQNEEVDNIHSLLPCFTLTECV